MNIMNSKHVFTLGRAIDKKYLPNQLIIIITSITLLAGIVIHFFSGYKHIDAIVSGVILALIVFLTWAFAREIYPKREYAAIAGTIICITILIWFEINPLIILILLWFIINLRLVNQTTGLEPSKFDRLMILILTILNSYIFSWIFLVFMVIIFAVNFRITKEKYDAFFILIGIILSIVFIFFQQILYNQDSLTYLNGLIVILLLIIFSVIIWLERNIYVIGNHSQKKVPVNRILSAQILSIIFIGIYVIWFGDKSLVMLIPIWCVLFCSIIFSFIQHYKDLKNRRHR